MQEPSPATIQDRRKDHLLVEIRNTHTIPTKDDSMSTTLQEAHVEAVAEAKATKVRINQVMARDGRPDAWPS